MAAGFAPAVADYYWVQALQLVGGASGAVSCEDYELEPGALIWPSAHEAVPVAEAGLP